MTSLCSFTTVFFKTVVLLENPVLEARSRKTRGAVGVEGCSRADGLQGAEKGVKDKEVGKACGCLLERRKRGNLKMAGRWGG